jgi:PiT family inorganic phosphate transporter
MGLASAMFFLFWRYFRTVRGEKLNLALIFSLVAVLCFATSVSILYKALKWRDIAQILGVSLVVSFIISAFVSLKPLKSRGGFGSGRTMGYLLIIALCFSAFAFGGNDIANAVGVFVTPIEFLAGRPTLETMVLLATLGGFFVAIGGFTWGHRVIRTSAYKITRLNPLTGLAAEYSNALTVFVFTIVPKFLIGFGVPVSTTHASIGSIMGVALASKGTVGIHRATAGKVVSFWFLTVPCVAVLSVGLFWLLDLLII